MMENASTNALQPVAGASVYVYQQGTTTPTLQTLYGSASGSSVLLNPLTANADGTVEAWVAAPESVTLAASKTGFTPTSIAAVFEIDEPSAFGWIDPRTYGAKFDGVTDDAAALVAAAVAAAGKTLFLPPGTALINSGTGIKLRSNTRVQGAGIGNTILKRGPALVSGACVIDCTGGTHSVNVSVRDLTVDGNSAAAASVTAEIVLGSTAADQNNELVRVEVKNWINIGVQAVGTSLVIDHCVLTGTGSATVNSGYGVWSGVTGPNTGLRVTGCHFTGCRLNAIFGGQNSFVYSGNHFLGNSAGGGGQIAAGGQGGVITGNIIDGAGSGVGASGVEVNGHVLITGNQIFGHVSGWGVALNPGNTQVVVSGNIIKNNGTAGVGLGNVQNATVVGNFIGDDQMVATQAKGVDIGVGADYITVLGNAFAGNTGANVSNGSVGAHITITPNE